MTVLIIGLGSIADKHIKALRFLNSEVIIYALRSSITAPAVDGIISIYKLNELSARPDFIIISNPTNLHLAAILSVIDLSIPIMIEKPVLHTLIGADQVSRQINLHNTLTYVACNLRFNPCIQYLKSFLATSSYNINEVNIYCGSYLPYWRPGKSFKEIYSANKIMGGGVHLDLFHEMDYACWLFGFPDKYLGFQSSLSTLDIDAVDYANYILNYSKFNISIILNYYRKEAKRTIEILFDTETWIVDLINCTIITDKGKIIFTSPGFNIMDTYTDQIIYFTDCIANSKTPMNTFDESLKILKISLNE